MISRRSLFAMDFDRPTRTGRASDVGWLRVHRTVMACRVEVTLEPDATDAIEAATDALDEADRVESLITVFRESSELSRVNSEAFVGCHGIDHEVFGLLQRCAQLTADTGGAFDITSMPLSRCWGFLWREGRVPAAADVQQALARVGMSRLGLDPVRRAAAFAVDGMEVNLHAIGKGYALDRMATVLRRRGVDRALLSAGGSSVLALDAPSGGWRVDVRSPIVDSTLAHVWLSNAALGTSGAGEQFVIENGMRYGHVIDPRTGWPAGGVVSATVIAHDAATADALSTAMLVDGPALAERWCRDHPETLVLLLVDDDTKRLQVYGECTGARLELT